MARFLTSDCSLLPLALLKLRPYHGKRVYLYLFTRRSPAAVDGRIGVGDVIVEVNAVSLECMSDEQAVSTLRDAVRNST